MEGRGCPTSLRNSEKTNKSDDLTADGGVRVPDLLWYNFTKSNIKKETTYTCRVGLLAEQAQLCISLKFCNFAI